MLLVIFLKCRSDTVSLLLKSMTLFSIKLLHAKSPASFWCYLLPFLSIDLTVSSGGCIFHFLPHAVHSEEPNCSFTGRTWLSLPVWFSCLFSSLSYPFMHNIITCPEVNCNHDLLIQGLFLNIGSFFLDTVQHLVSNHNCLLSDWWPNME